jgi:ankyrin repeat protein
MYLTYARHRAEATEDETLRSARALLEHGADPNVGSLWHGMPSPFTALTGAFGEGELGPVRQPRHRHSIALARALLAAGADANDPQALYNRMFGDDDDHFVLLFEFGLGRGSGGPWRERLGDAIDPPEELVRGQLRWAATHDQRARVRLLLAHGVDAGAAFGDGRTAIELAALTGNTAVVSILEAHGVAAPRFDDLEAFVAAVLAGDERIALAAGPELIERARAARPGLIVWAAARANTKAVDLLIRLGFDVNALGRADVPVEHEWETALHAAVSIGDRGLVERLLAAGADTTIEDARFEATALGWAEHFEQPELVALLQSASSAGH